MHRWVLAEFNTHRKFSRNSASSRAIPVHKRIEAVKTAPAMPMQWGRNQSGMSARAELTAEEIQLAKASWLRARDCAVEHALELLGLKLHKQLVNRLLEPFLMHTAIVSSTEWDNFFRQRCHPDAQPEIAAVAYAMREALEGSAPTVVYSPAYWHLPYITADERSTFDIDTLKKISTGRCCRVSYLNHDGQYAPEEDIAVFNKLLAADPPHASPLEHIAHPAFTGSQGNFDGWRQLRHELLNF